LGCIHGLHKTCMGGDTDRIHFRRADEDAHDSGGLAATAAKTTCAKCRLLGVDAATSKNSSVAASMLEQQSASLSLLQLPLLTVTAADLRAYANSSCRFMGGEARWRKKASGGYGCEGLCVRMWNIPHAATNSVSNHNFEQRLPQ